MPPPLELVVRTVHRPLFGKLDRGNAAKQEHMYWEMTSDARC